MGNTCNATDEMEETWKEEKRTLTNVIGDKVIELAEMGKDLAEMEKNMQALSEEIDKKTAELDNKTAELEQIKDKADKERVDAVQAMAACTARNATIAFWESYGMISASATGLLGLIIGCGSCVALQKAGFEMVGTLETPDSAAELAAEGTPDEWSGEGSAQGTDATSKAESAVQPDRTDGAPCIQAGPQIAPTLPIPPETVALMTHVQQPEKLHEMDFGIAIATRPLIVPSMVSCIPRTLPFQLHFRGKKVGKQFNVDIIINSALPPAAAALLRNKVRSCLPDQ